MLNSTVGVGMYSIGGSKCLGGLALCRVFSNKELQLALYETSLNDALLQERKHHIFTQSSK